MKLSTITNTEPPIVFKAVRTVEVFEYSPEIAFNWFITHLDQDPPLRQAFMHSLCFPAIISFIDWAAIRGYLKKKTPALKNQPQVRAMTEKEIRIDPSPSLTVVVPETLHHKAVSWQTSYEDSSLQWIREYCQCSWRITDFVAWCLEHGYLEQKEEVQ